MKNAKVRAIVNRRRDVNTFAKLSHANYILLENTEKKNDGYFYECMATILMSAFKFEAYLNHLGVILFPYWNEMERNLAYKAKLNIIRSHLKIKKTDGERPYQTLKDLFRFRNDVVHGKSEFLTETVEEEGSIEELRRKKPLTQWEKLCTIEFAKRSYKDTEKIVREIHEKAGLDEFELYHPVNSYTIQRLKEEK